MIPAAISAMFTKTWNKGLIFGWAMGFLASLLGLVLSYFGEFSYGPTLILSMGAFFLAALFIKIIFPGVSLDR
jgi:ABC-type Mn2+/Zn2+ transport system permease subunit